MGKRETVLMIHNPIGPLASDADVATSLRILACHSEFMPIHCMMHVHAGEWENQIKLFGVYANGGSWNLDHTGFNQNKGKCTCKHDDRILNHLTL